MQGYQQVNGSPSFLEWTLVRSREAGYMAPLKVWKNGVPGAQAVTGSYFILPSSARQFYVTTS